MIDDGTDSICCEEMLQVGLEINVEIWYEEEDKLYLH